MTQLCLLPVGTSPSCMPAGPSVQSNLHSKEITTAKVTAVSFGFFSDEEVRGESEVGRPELLLAHLRLRTRVGSSRPPGGGVEAAALPGRLRPGDWLPPPASAAHMQVRKFSVKQIVSPGYLVSFFIEWQITNQSPYNFCFNSRRCCASSERLAVGRASNRAIPIGSPVSSHQPYSPASINAIDC